MGSRLGLRPVRTRSVFPQLRRDTGIPAGGDRFCFFHLDPEANGRIEARRSWRTPQPHWEEPMGSSPHRQLPERTLALLGSFPAMHHPRSSIAVLRFRLAAVLLLGNCLVAVAAGGLLVRSAISNDRELMMIGSGLVILILILVVVQWLAASSAWCPLCRTPVLAKKRCMKHRLARTLLGSHRLRVAMAILFKNRFRCPYCNEPTGMDLREPRR
jgi:hypothetical protein